jgi:hypothetical protein
MLLLPATIYGDGSGKANKGTNSPFERFFFQSITLLLLYSIVQKATV